MTEQPQQAVQPFDVGNPFIGMILPHQISGVVAGQYAMVTLRVGTGTLTGHFTAEQLDEVIIALQTTRKGMAAGGLIVPPPGMVLPAPPNGQRGQG
jgi:hypothetical protein